MTRPAFIAPQPDSFSLANIDVAGEPRDWSKGWTEEWEPLLPTLTVAVVIARAPDLIDERDDARALKADPAQGLDEDLRDAFQQEQGADEWRDSFHPVMDYAWPVELHSDVDIQTAVDLIDIHAGSVALVQRGLDFGDEAKFEIVLTGGGANLFSDIARAYMCCGCVPPLKVLTTLGECGDNDILRRFPMSDVYERAHEWLDMKRSELSRQLFLITSPTER